MHARSWRAEWRLIDALGRDRQQPCDYIFGLGVCLLFSVPQRRCKEMGEKLVKVFLVALVQV